MKKFLLILLILLLIGALLGAYYTYENLKPVSSSVNNISFYVGKGQSLETISRNLYTEGLIRNQRIFKYYGIVKEFDIMLKEGVYDISPSSSVQEIYAILIEGRQELISVTIPEGYTSRKIAQIFEEKGIVKSEDFLNAIHNKNLLEFYNIPFDTAEGFLFPDTYSFQEDYPAILVVESLIENFYKNLKEIYPSYKKLTNKQISDIVILASIVEREYKSSIEAKKIASVFYNRLEKDMKLQSCATVMYVLTEEYGEKHRNRLFFDDLEVESLYNTYLYKGLPPGAISNPGYYALDAAFNPEVTDYIFFVVKDREKGLHRFSSKYSEHEEARLEYLSGFESKK
ncbi:MAG: endolytic transglycosylase MltG [Spirochaetales bacterium]|nr:endolytic transglycosylase MltG [Spirochaetales bacterium]